MQPEIEVLARGPGWPRAALRRCCAVIPPIGFAEWCGLAAAAVLAALVVGVQFASGAYRCDFTGTADEPAHVVSSLMVRDYVARGFPGSPLEFARSYYVHYPKVAIGHWPPVFYLLNAGWMLAFGRTRATMLALNALIAVLLGVSVYSWLKRDFSRVTAFFTAAILLTLPVAQFTTAMVSPDLLLCLLTLWAVLVYGKFRESSNRRRYGILAALLGLLALGTHGRGVCLIFVPAFAALAGGHYKLSRKVWFGQALLFAVVLVLAPLSGQGRFEGLGAMSQDFWKLLSHSWLEMGWPAASVALIGAVWLLLSGKAKDRWPPLLAIFPGVLLLHGLVHVGWERHYAVTLLPIGAGLFAVGWKVLSHSVPAGTRRAHVMAAMLVLFGCSLIANNLKQVWHKPDFGYHRWVHEGSFAANQGRLSLICGGATQEGALIAEIALRDPHLNYFILRGSKVLANSTWSGTNYRLRFGDSLGVAQYLNQTRIESVILLSGDGHAHGAQLLAAVNGDPAHWEKRSQGLPPGTLYFHRLGEPPPGGLDIRIHVQNLFGLDPGVGYREPTHW